MSIDTVDWGKVFIYPLLIPETDCNHCKQLLLAGEPIVLNQNDIPKDAEGWWPSCHSIAYCDPICKELED